MLAVDKWPLFDAEDAALGFPGKSATKLWPWIVDAEIGRQGAHGSSAQKRCVLTDCLPVAICGGTFHVRVLGFTENFRFSDALDELLSLKEKKRSFGEKERKQVEGALALGFSDVAHALRRRTTCGQSCESWDSWCSNMSW